MNSFHRYEIAKPYNPKNNVRYNKNKKRFEPWIVSDFLTPGPYFNTEAATLKAIELMGEERLKLIYGIK